ncbi:histone deacetylase family protein [Paraliomyxa miuraensis]|uniref:histone deacetylase family protein n=1 Tax=Paraliomyxa miuraensis TaxID=376150 RepID=UPI00224E0621|nr:histone deacetylase [Paraliomyxa miuraensis]MCX4239282.1 histone deacetylase [Paraliomyxa miuraensis]
MSSTLLLHHDTMIDHDPGRGHPERPDRLRAIVSALRERPVEGTRWATPSSAAVEAILRVHSPEHLARVDAARGKQVSFDPDTHASPSTVEASYLAAGAAVEAVDAVLDGHARNAFAFVRPPGHHAEPDRAMGFCLLNNVAIAAEHALGRPGIERVMVIDWDVHHGNGTQAAFYERRDVLFFSSHQFPFYPGTGAVQEHGRGEGEGHTINVPLSAGATDGDFRRMFGDVVVPAAERFDPQLVLVSAGFDAHCQDPLGGMALTEEGFADLCATVKAIADAHAGGRLVLVLEGGYDLEGLAGSARACVEILAGAAAPGGPDTPSPVGDRGLRQAVEHHRRYWPL